MHHHTVRTMHCNMLQQGRNGEETVRQTNEWSENCARACLTVYSLRPVLGGLLPALLFSAFFGNTVTMLLSSDARQ